MLLEFADDPTAGYLDRQYMLGPSILVAPVFTEGGQVDFYVPAGKWTHLVSGHTVSGPRWHHGRYDVLSLPVLVRPGAVIPIGAHSDRPDYDFADGVTLQAYELVDGAKVRVEVPDQSGRSDAVFEVSRNSTTVTAERVRGAKPWRLLLFGVRGARALSGGDAVQTADGTLVTPNQGASRLEVSLS
jgi:alpha-D-xyloside xylohydrolase